MMKKYARSSFALMAILLTFVFTTVAQTEPNKNFPNIKIKNFGQMDEIFYRGARPKKDDYQSLAAIGVKTVIDLTENPKDYAQPNAVAAGLKYINIPMSDKKYPKPEQIEQFLSIVNNPETGTFFVHCAGGRHRTGITSAVYRFTKYGWDYEKVYREMKNYDFYTRWGHGKMKDFVIDYANNLKSKETVETASDKR